MLGPRPQRFSRTEQPCIHVKMLSTSSGLATGTTGVEEQDHYLFSTNSVLLRGEHGGGLPAEDDVYATEDGEFGRSDAAMLLLFWLNIKYFRAQRNQTQSSLPAPLIPSKKFDTGSHSFTPTCFFPNSSELRVNFTEGFLLVWRGGP